MFDKKGQSALEYLMTYGWALVVIVIVIAALVILINPGSVAGPSCSPSFTGGKIPIQTHIASTTGVTLTTANGTAQDISGVTITMDGTIGAATVSGVEGVPADFDWASGTQKNIAFTQASSSGEAYNLTFTMDYTDAYSNARTVTATCTGTIP